MLDRICVALLVFCFGCLTARASDLTGTWTGTAYQNIGPTGYPAVLTFLGSGGVSDYPTLNCTGSLTEVSNANGYIFFTETITSGHDECIDGSVTLRVTDQKLHWGWVGVSGGKTIVGWADLEKAKLP